MKIVLYTEQEGLLNDNIFNHFSSTNSNWSGNKHWKSINIYLHDFLADEGIEITTYDLIDLNQADVILYFDLPKEKKTIDHLRKKSKPNARHLLMIRESPLMPYFYDRRNHELFDYILTYNPSLIDNSRYFHYWLPKSFPITDYRKSWEERKQCVLLNANYHRGIKSGSRPWSFFSKNIQYRKNGWKFSWIDVFKTEKGFLYDLRRNFVKYCNKYFPDFLDTYGRGWDNNNYNWYNRIIPGQLTNKKTKPYIGNKLDLFNNYRFVFAVENYKGNIGYISEKIFDAFYGGAVPIYLGEESIKEYITKSCFIDLREFHNFKELVQYCENMSKKEWSNYRKSINLFLSSETAKQFYPEYYANQILNVINKCSLKKEV